MVPREMSRHPGRMSPASRAVARAPRAVARVPRAVARAPRVFHGASRGRSLAPRVLHAASRGRSPAPGSPRPAIVSMHREARARFPRTIWALPGTGASSPEHRLEEPVHRVGAPRYPGPRARQAGAWGGRPGSYARAPGSAGRVRGDGRDALKRKTRPRRETGFFFSDQNSLRAFRLRRRREPYRPADPWGPASRRTRPSVPRRGSGSPPPGWQTGGKKRLRPHRPAR